MNRKIGISTARAGIVIGGGDYSENRIIPDCVRAAKKGEKIIVRNPNSIRPYEHVLDALSAYLLILEKQFNNIIYSGNYNIGPDKENIITNKELVNIFCEKWGNVSWYTELIDGPYESNYLKLNCDKIKNELNWSPIWSIDEAIEKTVEFEKTDEKELEQCMEKQINEFWDKIYYLE